MSDIVERLRAQAWTIEDCKRLPDEAADEIEQLRGEASLWEERTKMGAKIIEENVAEIERLRAVIIRAKDSLLDGQSTQWVHDLLVTAILGPKP